MSMLKLKMMAKDGNYYAFQSRKKNAKFISIRHSIAKKKKYKCQFCTANCEEQFEVINMDHNYKNNKMNNFALSCSLCARSQLLDYYTPKYSGKDKLIYWPDISQAKLNMLLMRMLSLSKDNDSNSVYQTKLIYSKLSEKDEDLKSIYGEESIKPVFFKLISMYNEASPELIKGIRILFSLDTVKELMNKNDVVTGE